jgi:hypothetical protein
MPYWLKLYRSRNIALSIGATGLGSYGSLGDGDKYLFVTLELLESSAMEQSRVPPKGS